LTTKCEPPFWIGDRLFSQEDLDLIFWTAKQYPDLSRTELACTICENLGWKAPNGKERFHSCLDLLEKLEADGMLTLPEKRKLAPYKKAGPKAAPLPQLQLKSTLSALRPVTVEPVSPEEKPLWDATMAAYHTFGFERAFGAHQCYWIHGHVDGKKMVAGTFLFAAPAKDVKVRDHGSTVPTTLTAGHFGGDKEKGTSGRFQQCRDRMAAKGPTGKSTGR